MKGDRERYLAVGMNDYVSKPIDPALLSAVITRHCNVDTELQNAVSIPFDESPDLSKEQTTAIEDFTESLDRLIG